MALRWRDGQKWPSDALPGQSVFYRKWIAKVRDASSGNRRCGIWAPLVDCERVTSAAMQRNWFHTAVVKRILAR